MKDEERSCKLCFADGVDLHLAGQKYWRELQSFFSRSSRPLLFLQIATLGMCSVFDFFGSIFLSAHLNLDINTISAENLLLFLLL